MSISKREQKAVARWKPGQKWYHPFMAAVVIRLCKFYMTTMNSLNIEGLEKFESLQHRQGRGLLTFSNHVSLFDDPLLPSNFSLPRYEEIRWAATDAINFFGSPLKSWFFTSGKGVPIVRGAGLDQSGFHFLLDRLREGQWVHIFPEGGRTRHPLALMTHPFKSGIGRLIAETQPIALPFYHHGMRDILPVGSMVPRRGKAVRLVFGDPIDCDERYLQGITRQAEGAELSGLALWEALAARTYDALRHLELAVHPSARELSVSDALSSPNVGALSRPAG
ncbi:MAG: 1-acyl-sn-glycerol-3-phosphate acyltransferase [Chloroflexi bacterium]|nr:1-acyl-sn-glycerol-3-phosphate acyltransferase [Chloroflexota bacterium]